MFYDLYDLWFLFCFVFFPLFLYTCFLRRNVCPSENSTKIYVICIIFELNTSFDINTSRDSEEESIQYHGQDLLAEKTLSVTLNDISSRNEVRASRYLTLKNKITVEEWRTTRNKTNLENFVLRERLVDKNGWQHYVY